MSSGEVLLPDHMEKILLTRYAAKFFFARITTHPQGIPFFAASKRKRKKEIDKKKRETHWVILINSYINPFTLAHEKTRERKRNPMQRSPSKNQTNKSK